METRDALLKAAKEAGTQMKGTGRAESNESVATMKKNGLKVQTATPEIEAAWRKAAEEFYPKIRGKIVPADMFDEVQRLLQEYRKAKS
jgi:TRAP-type C4-dicarboxylate transport system substrate-binding protein